MDPITQGALGASAGQFLFKNRAGQQHMAPVTIMAALAGMSPDLDVLIRSSVDPLLFLQYHRHFSHSLFFIPFGALLCAVFLHPLIGKKHDFSFWHSYLVCFAGYATHALLDACTTYGTLLLWPFSDERFAWNNVAVVDIFFTLPILIALFWGIKKQSPWPARIIFLWVFFYLGLGYWQKERAEQAAVYYLAQQSNIQFEQVSAKPSISNIVLWKIVYQDASHFYVDALHLGIFQSIEEAHYFPGERVQKLELERDFPWLEAGTQQALDVERFRWFSKGYIAKDPGKFTDMENRIMDVRYSIVPNEIHPLWSIGLNPEAEIWEHASYDNHRDASKEARQRFFDMLFAE